MHGWHVKVPGYVETSPNFFNPFCGLHGHPVCCSDLVSGIHRPGTFVVVGIVCAGSGSVGSVPAIR